MQSLEVTFAYRLLTTDDLTEIALGSQSQKQSFFTKISNRLFFDRYFERIPMVLRNECPSISNIDPLLSNCVDAVSFGDVRFVDQDKGGPGYDPTALAQEYGFTHMNLDAVRHILRKSQYSVFVGRFSRYSDTAAALQAGLADFLSSRVISACAISPAFSQATFTHYDPIDVFVLQLAGSKKWTLFEPLVHLPEPGAVALSMRIIRKRHLSKYKTVVLEPGDLLYIPRGWLHEVKNPFSSISVHVSLLAYVNTVRSFVEKILSQVLNEECHESSLKSRLVQKNAQLRRRTRQAWNSN